MEYEDYIKAKTPIHIPTGISGEWDDINPSLFPFQSDIVRWAIRKGRCAIFADCGMGKTFMQLEWANHIPGKILILAPLAVAPQTVKEGKKLGIQLSYARNESDISDRITITNYEMLDHFDPGAFNGVILDESSILKSFDGKTKEAILTAFRETRFKLACTATPAPNDFMELGNHSEFVGALSRQEMLAMFFVHDGGETQKWRLKNHAKKVFWDWMASWAISIRRPSDLGYPDDSFILPELRMHEQCVEVSYKTQGRLFAMPASTLQERIRARKESINERVGLCSDLVNGDTEQWIVWCNLNGEADLLEKAIPGSVNIQGSNSREKKIQAVTDFIDGKVRVLISKPSILGFGINLQCCHKMAFVGLSDSWEQFYQAVRRCWRFGQRESVDVHLIIAETEGAVLENIKRKEADAETMSASMADSMKEITMKDLHGQSREFKDYEMDMRKGENYEVQLGDCVDIARSIHDETIHYSIFSPPFSSLYVYSDSPRDMGNCDGDGQFMDHFGYLVKELYRILIPGRLVSFHCMNLPTSKSNHGFIGIRDFRGELIRLFESHGFIFHSEVCIWKDPVVAMQRTKALGLLWKQIKKDSAMSRQGIPDYLVTMRKPGDNPEPITHTPEEFPVRLWQKYASPVWMDINPSDTLQYRSARSEEDERHICPLQLQVIERGIDLWSSPGDIVFSPFAGIGSEGYVALRSGRRFIGAELKRSYWEQACRNLETIKKTTRLFPGFDAQESVVVR